MKRTRLRRRTPLRARTGLAASRKRLAGQSTKRKAGKLARDEVREAVFARAGWRCQAGVACAGPLTFHHRRKASAGGAYSVANGVALCVGCNGWVEDNPVLARERWGTWLVMREGDSGWHQLGERSNRT